MDTLEHLRRLHRYEDWANRRTLAALRAPGAASERAAAWMGHVVGASRLWLSRLQRDPHPPQVWPRMTPAECDQAWADTAERWSAWIAELRPDSLSETIEYVNSKGEPWTSSVEDVLTHLALHSAYHRGQIAADLRARGCEPPYTDFVHAARQGLVP